MHLNNNWTRSQLKRQNEILASQIGIPYELLIQTKWDIIEHKNEDGFVGSFTVKFRNTSSKILSRIPNIENENEVFVSLFIDYDEDYVDYQERYEVIISHSEPYLNLYDQLFKLRQFNYLYLEDKVMLSIHRTQLFVNGISSLEIFLLDTFILMLDLDAKNLKKFTANYSPYKDKKIPFSSIYEQFDIIEKTIKDDLSNITYHNLERIKPMYESTFGIEFPEIKKLSRYIQIRHDLVHRNGKQKNNNEIKINENMVSDLLSEIMNFANELVKKLNLC